MERRCQHCGSELPATGRLFCSDAHRKRAWRRRHAGVRESAFPDGGSRGHVRLEQPTRRELARVAELRAARDALAPESVYELRGLRVLS
jgi:hypothetical protein